MKSDAMFSHCVSTAARARDRTIPARIACERSPFDSSPQRFFDSRKSFRKDSNQVQSGG